MAQHTGHQLTLRSATSIDFRKSKGSDIIQSLVSIYDTKDVFIKELQVRIAQQLLAITDYVLDAQVRFLFWSFSRAVPDHSH